MKLKNINMKRFLIGAAVGIFVLVALTGGALADRLFNFKPLDLLLPRSDGFSIGQKILTEESVVIAVAEKVSPSVVTVSVQTPEKRILEFNPFSGFSQRVQGGQSQDIGTGFIVSKEGLIVTNKHVVSVQGASYKVITKDDKEYEVKEINKDPSNDIAILKIDAGNLVPVELGDSANLKVGQFVIAIGTALGEFRSTVTTGVVSGLGRGITAGNPLEGYVEKLDDVIQTDAAINPGNSGGPLVNSLGQVIGINVAVAQDAQNIGFAIPINTVKESLRQFQATGKFQSKAYLGVQYQMISRQTAVLNNVPQGAYVVDVVSSSPAKMAGIQVDDIITKLDGQELNDKNTLADVVSKKQSGDRVSVEVWRDGQTLTSSVILSESQGN